jgi:hypothetical protein
MRLHRRTEKVDTVEDGTIRYNFCEGRWGRSRFSEVGINGVTVIPIAKLDVHLPDRHADGYLIEPIHELIHCMMMCRNISSIQVAI